MSGDEPWDRPWTNQSLLVEAEPENAVKFCTLDETIVSTPEGATAFFDSLLAFTIHCCEFDGEGKKRAPKRRHDALLAEAVRCERGEGWRGDNPELAQMFAAELRQRAADQPLRGRGRPAGQTSNPARQLLEQYIAGLENELSVRGSEKATTVRDPGKPPNPGEKGGMMSGISAVVTMVLEVAKFAKIPLSKDEIALFKRAADDIRRSERRKRKSRVQQKD